MAEYSLGTAHGTVKIDSDTSGVDKANQSLGGLDAKAQKSGVSIDQVGNKMGLAGLAIAGGLGVAVNTAASFEQQLSGIQAVSGATAGEMDLISKAALRIGKDTTFSASEAAGAMTELAKAGVPVEAILGGVADATVALAAATGVDLSTAATIASDTMNMFGLEASDMNGIVDTLAQTANASSIDVTDLGMAFSQVGAVANLAGLSVEDTASAIGQLGDAGIKGSDAGTSLKTMLMNLQPSTEKAAATFKELGIITEDGSNRFYDAQGNLKSLKEVQEILRKSTEGLSSAEKQMALETMFGSDAIRAAAVMAENGAEGFDLFAKKQADTGTAAEQAKIRQDNLKGSIEELKGSLETAGIAIGTVLMPAIRKLVDFLTSLLSKFLELDDTTQKWILGIIGATGSLLLFGAAVIKTVSFFRSLHAALITLRIISTATRASFIATAATSVASALRSSAAWVASAAKTVAAFLLMGARATANAIKVAAAWVVSAGAAAAKAAAQTAAAVARIVAGWVLMGAQALLQAARMAAAWLIAMGPVGWVIAIVIALVALIIANWDKVKAWTIKAWNAVTGAIKTAASNVWNAIKSMASSVISAVSGLWSKVKSAFSSGVSTVISFVSALPGKIRGFFAGAGQWLISAGKDLLSGIWNGISSAGGWLKDKILGWASGLVDSVLGFFGISSPSKVFAEIGDFLVAGLAEGIEKNDAAVSSATSAAAAVVGAMQDGLALGAQMEAEIGATVGASLTEGTIGALGGSGVNLGSSVGTAVGGVQHSVGGFSKNSSQAAIDKEFGRMVRIEMNTYNPVAEKASDSEARKLRAAAAVGAF